MNSISLVLSNIYYIDQSAPQIKKKAYFSPVKLFQPTLSGCHLRQRVIKQLDSAELFLDSILPDFFFQQKIDKIGNFIESAFKPLCGFNQWLDKYEEGHWYTRLATFLCKLPMRVIRNYVSLLYHIIRTILQSAVHPLKAITKFAKLTTELIYQFTMQPTIYSNMGASMIGASLGQTIIAKGMIPPMGIGIGTVLIIAALCLDGLKMALNSDGKKEWGTLLKNKLLEHFEQMPEALLTGLGMGMVIGAIQRQVDMVIQRTYHEGIKTEVNKKLAEYYLPPSSDISLDASRGVIVKWSIKDISQSMQWILKRTFSDTSLTAKQWAIRIPPDVANIPPVEVFVPNSIKVAFSWASVGVVAISPEKSARAHF